MWISPFTPEVARLRGQIPLCSAQWIIIKMWQIHMSHISHLVIQLFVCWVLQPDRFGLVFYIFCRLIENVHCCNWSVSNRIDASDWLIVFDAFTGTKIKYKFSQELNDRRFQQGTGWKWQVIRKIKPLFHFQLHEIKRQVINPIRNPLEGAVETDPCFTLM